MAFFAFYILVVLGCLFDRSCPPCEILRRNPDAEPYSKKEVTLYSIIMIVCTSGVLILCVVSFSLIPEMKSNLSMTSCSIYLTLDSALNGDSTWGGFSELRNKIGTHSKT